MSMLVEFSIVPMDQGEHVGRPVAEALAIVEKSGLDYRLGPMGTCLEGKDWDETMEVVKNCFERLRLASRRILLSIKVDYHEGRSGALISKVKSVERHLGHPLKK